ncbi:hypothetical protein V2J09_000731 [Rumex salicifolius]
MKCSINYSLPIFIFTLSTFLLESFSTSQEVFNVDDFGAKGDGMSDSTKAFEAAWEAMCGAEGPSEMFVPKGRYLVQPMTLTGKCRCPSPTVRIDGWLLGPTNYVVISKAGRWIVFEGVDNLVIQGGTLVGRGKYLFQCKTTSEGDPKCPAGGKMLIISKSNNVWINNITSINSQGFHMTVENSDNVHIYGAKFVAPENSPNTDGIHIGKSTGVTITSTTIQTGDDCISLGEGSQNIWMQDINCGPGHGISIGSLGSQAGELGVRNVTATGVKFRGTQNGFRIKTWAKPFDVTIDDIHFLSAVMTDVENPIIIDQNYCPSGGCSTSQPSYAKISDVEFRDINGTSATEIAVEFDCSSKFPCTGMSVQNVQLSHTPEPAQSEVKNARVQTIGVVEPNLGST